MLKFQVTDSASMPPVADLVPAGTVTWNSVAMGRRSTNAESYWKVSVRVPIQVQVPGKAGSICTGTSSSDNWLIVPNGTMG